jgi:hypothetical protein
MDQLENTSFEMINLKPNCSLVNQLETQVLKGPI